MNVAGIHDVTPIRRARRRGIARWPAMLAACALLAAPCGAAWGAAWAAAPEPDALGFMGQLYAAHDDYRAETEALRWLHDNPQDEAGGAVALLRAKLYYRERRYAEADLMLYALLDRTPAGAVAGEARRLLAYSQLRQGRVEDGARLLAFGQPDAPDLAPLRAMPQAQADADRAVLLSSVLPGSGFLVLGEPAKAASALGLNALALAGAVLTYRQGNTAAALLFALVEYALYTGGRDAVREEAEALALRDRRRRTETWLRDAGEPDLLRVGLTLHY